MKKVPDELVIIAAVVFFIVLGIGWFCAIKSPPSSEWRAKPTIFKHKEPITAKIIDVHRGSIAMNWKTLVEHPDGKREELFGKLGKVGETITIK